MSNDELTLEEIRAQRKHECALGYRLFAALRWGDLGDGHISARDPINTDCFWMLPYGAAYQDATPSNLILVSKDGSTIAEPDVTKESRTLNFQSTKRETSFRKLFACSLEIDLRIARLEGKCWRIL